MKIVLYSILAFLCPVCISFAQSPPANIRPLMIGDTLPRGIVLKNVLNHPVSKIQLDDYRGKAVILDFWATYCAVCVQQMPKVDSIQKRYREDLQIILVGNQKSSAIGAFLKKESTISTTLPIATEDSLLHSLFPFRSIPHQIWLDSTYRIVAITGPDQMTDRNIGWLVSHSSLMLPTKVDRLDFDRDQPLYQNIENVNAANVFQTTICGSQPGISKLAGTRIDSVARTKRIFYYNFSLPSLYSTLDKNITANRILIDSANSRIWWDRTSSEEPFLVCVEQLVPLDLAIPEVHAIMLQQMNNYLRIAASWEQRTVNAFVITCKRGAKGLPVSSGGKSTHNFYAKSAPLKKMQNSKLSVLVEFVNNRIPARPDAPILLDETGLDYPTDIELVINEMHDMRQLREALQPIGLDLIQVKRTIPMFVVTQQN